jgi:putative hydrolase of the HAD superfamily
VLAERYWEHRAAYDRGGSAASFWGEVVGATIPAAKLARLVALDVESWTSLNRETLRVLGEARDDGLAVSLLSNAPLELADALSADPTVEAFDHLLFSSHLGIVKPEPSIFERAVAILSLPPEQILFVDDKTANVEAAREAGLGAVVFTSPAQLRSDVREWAPDQGS